ncbi:hypothetical protein AVEN_189457-1 [Araneus ventricosus]|uniref:Uncharacterized protein n=1 Tax=Araneus ventricosus TaxID=182803 RepID=A0A4Y2V0Y7_ARAVE|nr:hypothetical protein AVEN_56708-1 [Araneus ventricosus]GBO18024.1 hypothetical protein AVEN_189457-1 [Araneus ventricosus]
MATSDYLMVCPAFCTKPNWITNIDVKPTGFQNRKSLLCPAKLDLSLLTTEASDFSETDDLEESEPKLTDSRQSVSNKLILESQKEHRKSQIVSDGSTQNSLPSFDLQHTLSNSFQAFSLKDIVDIVKPFSSRDNYSIQTFISDVEDIFNFHEIKNSIHQGIFVKKSLTCSALTLMRSIRGITNSEQMKQHSLDEFSDKINDLQLRKLMESRHMKPFETLQEYFLAMRDLAHKGSLDDSSLIEYVLNGIPDSSNNKIILHG